MSDQLDIPALAAAAEQLTEALLQRNDSTGLQQLAAQIDSFTGDKERMTSLCGEVDSLELEKATLQQLFKELNKARNELSEVSKNFEELNVPMRYDASKQKKLWEKCLGLEFRMTEDKAMSLVFTNINSTAPEQRYTVTLDVSEEDGQWSVVHLDPTVHGVRPLLNELNRTSNLTQFCKEIRKKFKEHSTSNTQEPSNQSTD